MVKNRISVKVILIMLGIFLFFALISFLNIKYFLDPQGENSRSIHDAPIITLKGDYPTKIGLNSNYIEKGATAIDNHDKDITTDIVISNDIDTTKLGTYYVTYKIEGGGKNNAQVQRKVEVIIPNTAGIPILMYHFFYDSSKGETAADANFTDVNNFRQQIKYLKDNDYYFPTWPELNDYLDDNSALPEKSIIITDDDGSESFFRLAYPVLKEYQVRATSFIITSWTPNPDSLNVDRNLIKFESHSDNMHQGGCPKGHGGLFLCIDHEAGKKDLIKSKQITGDSEVFCYPFGDYSDYTKQLLRETGYIMAVTTEWGKATPTTDKLALPRIRIQGTYSLDGFIGAIK